MIPHPSPSHRNSYNLSSLSNLIFYTSTSSLLFSFQDTAQQAFNFCLKYKRHTEFRRLSEMLRTHLANIGRNTNQTQAINLNSPESLQLHLDTRFAQLNAATDLELWQVSTAKINQLLIDSNYPINREYIFLYFHSTRSFPSFVLSFISYLTTY